METLFAVVRYSKNEFTGQTDKEVLFASTIEMDAMTEYAEAVTSDMKTVSYEDERIHKAAQRNTANGYKGYCVLELELNLEQLSTFKL